MFSHKAHELEDSIATYGIVNSGKVSEVSGSVEAGKQAKLTKNISAGVSGFGDFSEGASTYGAKAGVSVCF